MAASRLVHVSIAPSLFIWEVCWYGLITNLPPLAFAIASSGVVTVAFAHNRRDRAQFSLAGLKLNHTPLLLGCMSMFYTIYEAQVDPQSGELKFQRFETRRGVSVWIIDNALREYVGVMFYGFGAGDWVAPYGR